MEELADVLARDPTNLSEWRARPETWRAPLPRPSATRSLSPPKDSLRLKIPRQLALPATATNPAAVTTSDAVGPLKLYQAAHQRYYLVAASLAKITKGLADKCVQPARRQSATFVLRRLVPKPKVEASATPDEATWTELAFVRGPRGYQWRAVPADQRARLADTEQINPLFRVSYSADGGRRNMFAGLVPVAKRETYLGAPPESPSEPPAASVQNMEDPRLARLRADVIEPWRSLVEQAGFAATQNQDWTSTNRPALYDELGPSSPPASPGLTLDNFEKIQTGSWYVARDLLAFTSEHLPAVYDAIRGDNTALNALPATERAAQQAVLDWLGSVTATSLFVPFSAPAYGYTVSTHLRGFMAGLVGVIDLDDPTRDHLERVDVPFRAYTRDPDWPTVLFPLANPTAADGAGPLPAGTFANAAAAIESLEGKVKAALSPKGEEHYATQVALPHELSTTEGWFWIRCVFEDPACAPFFGALVSDPTDPFQMAPFFDPDAPARPIRIPMPMDISPAGLRKFSKNASFVISDMLCSKIKSIRKLTLGDLVLSVLPWPFHKDLPTPTEPGPCVADGTNIGMVCSLSIPIVTLCAMILMFIMVLLFDYVFRWVPYLLMCFPLPGLKAKKEA